MKTSDTPLSKEELLVMMLRGAGIKTPIIVYNDIGDATIEELAATMETFE